MTKDSKIAIFAGIYLAIFSQFIIAGIFGYAPLIRAISFIAFSFGFPLIIRMTNHLAKNLRESERESNE